MSHRRRGGETYLSSSSGGETWPTDDSDDEEDEEDSSSSSDFEDYSDDEDSSSFSTRFSTPSSLSSWNDAYNGGHRRHRSESRENSHSYLWDRGGFPCLKEPAKILRRIVKRHDAEEQQRRGTAMPTQHQDSSVGNLNVGGSTTTTTEQRPGPHSNRSTAQNEHNNTTNENETQEMRQHADDLQDWCRLARILQEERTKAAVSYAATMDYLTRGEFERIARFVKQYKSFANIVVSRLTGNLSQEFVASDEFKVTLLISLLVAEGTHQCLYDYENYELADLALQYESEATDRRILPLYCIFTMLDHEDVYLAQMAHLQHFVRYLIYRFRFVGSQLLKMLGGGSAGGRRHRNDNVHTTAPEFPSGAGDSPMHSATGGGSPTARTPLTGSKRLRSASTWIPKPGERVVPGPAFSEQTQADECSQGIVQWVTENHVVVRWEHRKDEKLYRYSWGEQKPEIISLKEMRSRDAVINLNINFVVEEFHVICAVLGVILSPSEIGPNSDSITLVIQNHSIDICIHLLRHPQLTDETMARVLWLIMSLVAIKKLSTQFIEKGGFEDLIRILQHTSITSFRYGVGSCISQLCSRHDIGKIMDERDLMVPVFDQTMLMLQHPAKDVKGAACEILRKILAIPAFLSMMDEKKIVFTASALSTAMPTPSKQRHKSTSMPTTHSRCNPPRVEEKDEVREEKQEKTVDDDEAAPTENIFILVALIQECLRQAQDKHEISETTSIFAHCIRVLFVYVASNLMLSSRFLFRRQHRLSKSFLNANRLDRMDIEEIESVIVLLDRDVLELMGGNTAVATSSSSSSSAAVSIMAANAEENASSQGGHQQPAAQQGYDVLTSHVLPSFVKLLDAKCPLLLFECLHEAAYHNNQEIIVLCIGILHILSVPSFCRVPINDTIIIREETHKKSLTFLLSFLNDGKDEFRQQAPADIYRCLRIILLLLKIEQPHFTKACKTIRASDGLGIMQRLLKQCSSPISVNKYGYSSTSTDKSRRLCESNEFVLPVVSCIVAILVTLQSFADTAEIINCLGIQKLVWDFSRNHYRHGEAGGGGPSAEENAVGQETENVLQGALAIVNKDQQGRGSHPLRDTASTAQVEGAPNRVGSLARCGLVPKEEFYFMNNVKCLVVGESSSSSFLPSVMTDHMEALEREEIMVSSTITYKRESLLQLIADELEADGLRSTAATLRNEARSVLHCQLKPPVGSPLNSKWKIFPRGSGPSSATFGAPAIQTESLDHIVKSYIRRQHELCSAPIATFPPVDLLAQHRCPCIQPANLTQRNLLSRMRYRRLGPMETKSVAHFQHRFIHSKYRMLCDLRASHHEDSAQSLAFIDDGETMLVGSSEGTIVFFDVRDSGVGAALRHQSYQQPVIHSLFEEESVEDVFASKDSTLIAVCSLRSMTLYSRNEIPTVKLDVPEVKAVDFTANNSHLITTDVDTFEQKSLLYDITTGQQIASFQDQEMYNSQENSRNLAMFDRWGQLVLNNAVLYDVRMHTRGSSTTTSLDSPAAHSSIMRFDRITEHARSTFHPNNMLVIVNQNIWDLRMQRLMMSCPDLAETIPYFAQSYLGKTVIYARVLTEAHDSIASPCHLNVLDASNFEKLSNFSNKHKMSSFAVDPWDRRLAGVFETEDEYPIVKMFAVGQAPQSRQAHPVVSGEGYEDGEGLVGASQSEISTDEEESEDIEDSDSDPEDDGSDEESFSSLFADEEDDEEEDEDDGFHIGGDDWDDDHEGGDQNGNGGGQQQHSGNAGQHRQDEDDVDDLLSYDEDST